MNEAKATKAQSDFEILVEDFYKENSEAQMLIEEIFNYCRNLKGFEPKQNTDTAEPQCETGVLGILQGECNKLNRNNSILRQIRDHLSKTIGH